jgi:hypothetical protein
MKNFDLNKLEGLLNKFAQAETAAVLLLESFKKLGSPSEYEPKDNIAELAQLLERFKQSGVYRFNIFRKLDIYANEHHLNDVIGQILDPRKNEPYARLILSEVLNQFPSSPAAQNIRSLIEEGVPYSVYREYDMYNSIPDICLRSDKFMVFIENKMRGGTETGLIGDQTVRHWAGLCAEATRLNISSDCLLGIFLTPEGALASSENFEPISSSDFRGAIEKALQPDISLWHKYNILSFLDFYQEVTDYE